MAKALIYDVEPSLVFEWFYKSAIEDCGDGGAIICCGNTEEALEQFQKWAEKSRKHLHKQVSRYVHNECNFISIHDSNESFIFSDKEYEMPFNEVSFVVVEDCISKYSDLKLNSIKGRNNEYESI